MPQLNANNLQLRQIERQRGLASALQQSALDFQPIQHLLQGIAKLAQAIASNSINNRADEKTEKLRKREQAALADALNARTPENVFGTGGQPRSAEDRLRALSQVNPGLATQVQAGLLDRQLQLEGGVSDEQLNAMFDPTMQARRNLPPALQDAAQLDQAGVDLTFGNIINPQTNQRQGAVRVPGGGVFLSDPSQPYGLGQPAPPGAEFVSTALNASSADGLSQNARSKAFTDIETATVAFDQIDRLRSGIAQGALSEENVVGGLRKVAEEVRVGLGELGRTATVVVRGQEGRDNGALGNVNAFRGYGSQNVTESDLARYGRETVADNLSEWEKLQALDAESQQMSISLAYTLARIADPGGRLSEMDVLNQVRALGLSSGSPVRRLAALESAEREFALKMRTRVDLMNANTDSPINLPQGINDKLDSVLNRPANFGSDVNMDNLMQRLSTSGAQAGQVYQQILQDQSIPQSVRDEFRRAVEEQL